MSPFSRFASNISRRKLLNASLFLLALYPAKRFLDILGYEDKNERKGSIYLSMDLPEGVSFHDSVIAVKKREEIGFLSSSCTHLGCRIDRQSDNQLICPCHGSRFTLDGAPLKGPAKKALIRLEFEVDLAKRRYKIYLSV